MVARHPEDAYETIEKLSGIEKTAALATAATEALTEVAVHDNPGLNRTAALAKSVNRPNGGINSDWNQLHLVERQALGVLSFRRPAQGRWRKGLGLALAVRAHQSTKGVRMAAHFPPTSARPSPRWRHRSGAEIAAHLDMTVKSIWSGCHAHGVRLRKPPSKQRDKILKRLHIAAN